MADGRDQFLVQRPSRSVQLIRCPPLHCSLGLPLFLFLLNVACSVLCGIPSIVIFSTCPNHRSLRWTTLSNRVLWIPNACLISSFLIFCSLLTPAILRSQLISAVVILFSSCFRIVKHSDPICPKCIH